MKFLPCENIINDSDFENIISKCGRCLLCKSIHDIKELEDEEFFFIKTNNFAKTLDQQLKNLYNIVKSNPKKLEEHVEELKASIEKRVVNLKSELEDMKSDYFKSIEKFKDKIQNELEKIEKEEENEHDKNKTLIHKMLTYYEDLNMDSKNKIRENAEDLIIIKNKIKYYNLKYTNLITSLKFNLSNEPLSKDILGTMFDELRVGENIEFKQFKEKNLTSNIKHMSMCKVGDNLLFTESKGSNILKYNFEFALQEKISSINSIKLKNAKLIASDELNNVYILLKNDESEILITDLNIRMIKHKSIKRGDETFQDMKYCNNQLHVLSEKAILIYTSKGEFLKELELRKQDNTYLSNPKMMCTSDSLAILLDEPSKLYFFDKESRLMTFTTNLKKTVKAIYLLNGYLFVHAACDGSFICYKITSDNKNIVQVFARDSQCLQEVSASIVYYNNQLVILFPYQNKLVLFGK